MRCIDADAIPWTDLNDNPNSKVRVLVAFADKVNRMPTIEPGRKKGKWIIRKFGADAMCSNCGMYFHDVYDIESSDNYCRHCGAQMEGLEVVDDE